MVAPDLNIFLVGDLWDYDTDLARCLYLGMRRCVQTFDWCVTAGCSRTTPVDLSHAEMPPLVVLIVDVHGHASICVDYTCHVCVGA